MWLMRQSLAEAIEHARAQALQAPKTVVEAFERSFVAAGAMGEPRIFKRAGDVAQIDVVGVLTPKPDYYAYWYGGGNTTYPEILQSLQLASADDSIKRVVLNVCSPGGYVAGLFDVLGALEVFKKSKETLAAQADSAAYAIAALGGKITAKNKASDFGSVGVCATYVRYDGVNIYEITSSNAPAKRPDPSTKEGQQVIRGELDALEELFIDAIARGRKTSVKNVKANFGRGAVLLAGAALDAGMIDVIAGNDARSENAAEGGAEPAEPSEGDEEVSRASKAIAQVPAALAAPVELAAGAVEQLTARAHPQSQPAQPAPKTATADPGGAAKVKKKMNKEEFKAQHPELYSVVFNEGKADAEKTAKEATASEKDRVEAHLTAGEESGDMKTALASIRSGEKMTQSLMTKYMMAGIRKGAVEARAEDDKTVAAATSGVAGATDQGKSLQDQIADEIDAQTKGTKVAAA